MKFPYGWKFTVWVDLCVPYADNLMEKIIALDNALIDWVSYGLIVVNVTKLPINYDKA